MRRPTRPASAGARRASAGDAAADRPPGGRAAAGAHREAWRPATSGEIEVREGGWRVRLRRATPGGRAAATWRPAAAARAPARLGRARRPRPAARARRSRRSGRACRRRSPTGEPPRSRRPWATSARCGGLDRGRRVRVRRRIGHVDVLGVRQDVVAPVDGVVGPLPGRGRRGRRVRPGARPLVEAGRRRRPWPTAPCRRPADVRADPHRQPRRDRPAHPARLPDAWASGPSSPTARPTATALAVQLADEAICIGPADARRSYLSAPAIMSAAVVTGCDAIHPGYGFLSEDDAFAEVVRAHGLTFIGPPAEVLERFASKEGTRRLLARPRPAHHPRLAGMLRDDAHALAEAERDRLPGADQAVGGRRRQGHAHGPLAARAGAGPHGLPLGGAGRVRRRLAVPGEVAGGQPPRRGPGRRSTATATASTSASATARSSGATRRSSRRRPSPALSPDGRRGAVPSARVEAVVAAGYENVGTLEFLVDQSTATAYFIEINCRIQVEHPVTEMLTGHRPRGRADPDRRRRAARATARRTSCCAATPSSSASTPRMRPTTSGRRPARSSGTWRPAAPACAWTRHLYSGYEVPPYYDSLLGKLVVWGPDRAAAIARARGALDELVLEGVITNIATSTARCLAQRDRSSTGALHHQPARPGRQRGVLSPPAR